MKVRPRAMATLLVAMTLAGTTIAGPAAPGPQRTLPERDAIEMVHDVLYARAARIDGSPIELQLDAAVAPSPDDRLLPALIYVHGGGWAGGSREQGAPFIMSFARGGYLAVTISYRLAGDAPFPAAVHDCKAAVRFLRAHAEALGIDPERIGVMGHSAGGHLAAMLGTTGDADELEGAVGETGVSSRVACVAAISAPTELSRNLDRPGRGMIRRWLGPLRGEALREQARRASPVTHVDPSDPPFIIVHGTADPVVSPEQSRLLHATLSEQGVSTTLHLVEGEGHAIRDLAAYERVAAFFDERLGGSAAEVVRQIRDRRDGARRPAGAEEGDGVSSARETD